MGEKQQSMFVLPLVPAGKMVLEISMFPMSTLVKASLLCKIKRKK